MKSNLFKYIFLSLTFYSFCFGSYNDTKVIADLSAKPLYELDKDGLNKVLLPLITNSKVISTVRIIDLSYNEIYWTYNNTQEDNRTFTCKKDEIEDSFIITFDESKIGNVLICYSQEVIPLEHDFVKYTQEEKKWLKDNPVIKVASMDFWPTDIYDKNIHVDYTNLLSRYGNLNISLVDYSNWDKALKATVKGEKVQAILDLSWSKDREEKMFNYSKSYFYTPLYIIVKNDNNDISTIEDLKDKSVFIERGSISNEIVKQLNLNITAIPLKDNNEMVKQLSSSKSQGEALLTYLLDENLLKKYNLKVVKKFYNKYGEVYIGSTKKYPILKSILNKAHMNIPKNELEFIQNKVYKLKNNKQLKLTDEEKNWLKENKTLTFSGNPNWMPFERFNDKNVFEGFTSDYLKKFKDITNINIEIRKTRNWNETLNLIKDNKPDIVSAELFSISNSSYKPINPYFSSNIVIVMKDNASYIENLNSLKDKKVALLGNNAYLKEIYRKYPGVNFYELDSIKEGLNSVSIGKYDAILGSAALMSYSIKNLGFENLRIVGSTDIKLNLTFYVKKDKEQLFNILSKYMRSLSEQEHADIKNKYSRIDFKTVVDYTLIWYILLIGLFLLILIGYYNRRLKFLVDEKTYQLKDLNKNLEKKVELRTKELTDEKNRAEKLNDELKEEKEHIDKLNKELNIAKESAENVAKQKSEFLANMSHEIRTPMNSVIGFTDILDKELTDPVQKDYLSAIKKGGASLLRIINDILDLSKIEAGKLEIRNESINPKSLFSEIESIFHSKIISKNINFDLEIDKSLPQYIILDGVRLRQILFNLIGNAIKFTEKGYIKLKVENIYKDDIKSKVDLIFSVEDTGLGIDKENLDSIFKAFEQQSNQDVAKYGGTGLGLAICTKLVKMMNGVISVESKKGEGTKFTVKMQDIPVSSVTQEISKQKTKSTSINFHRASILVVDDVEENRKLLQAALKDYDINLIMAENGQEALDKLKSVSVDLVFMDLRMPIMNGYEAVENIKKDSKLNKIPVVALTASVMGKDLEKVSEYGFDGYLRKPVILEDLIEEMTKHLMFDEKVKKEDTDNIEQEISEDTLLNIVQKLEGTMYDEWSSIKDSGDFTLIEEFALKLKDLGQRENILLITNYSNEIIKNIEAFDIERIDFLMNSYLELIKNLKDKI